MGQVKVELQRLEKLENDVFKVAGLVPAKYETHELLWLSTVYLQGAKAVYADKPEHWQPFVQLAGHATECALKCLLLVQGVKPPRGASGHDLVELLHLAEGQGFNLPDIDCRTVIALSRLYSREPFAKQSFLSRYPAKHWLAEDLPVPTPPAIQRVVDAVFSRCTPP